MANTKVPLKCATFVSSYCPRRNFANLGYLLLGNYEINKMENKIITLFTLDTQNYLSKEEVKRAELVLPIKAANDAENLEICVGAIIEEYKNNSVTWENKPEISYMREVQWTDKNKSKLEWRIDITWLINGMIKGIYPQNGIGLIPMSCNSLIEIFMNKNEGEPYIDITNIENEINTGKKDCDVDKSLEPLFKYGSCKKDPCDIDEGSIARNNSVSNILNNCNDKISVIMANYIVNAPNIVTIPNGGVVRGLIPSTVNSSKIHLNPCENAKGATEIVIEKSGVYFISVSIALAPGTSNTDRYSFNILIPSIGGGFKLTGVTTEECGGAVLCGQLVEYLPDETRISIQNISSNSVGILNGESSGTAVKITIFRVGDRKAK